MVSLSDLRARRVVPTWQEAVAVVQELLSTTLSDRGDAGRLPDVAHFALTVEGRVVLVAGGPSPDHPVRHLVAILDMLLEGIAAPQPLHELAERNRGEQPECTTAEQLASALAFFERPDRHGDISQLVGRALTAAEQTRADEELERLIARTRESAGSGDDQQQPEAAKHQLSWAVVAGVGVTAACVAAIVTLFVFARSRPATVAESARNVAEKPLVTETAPVRSGPKDAAASATAPSAQPASFLQRVSQAVRSTVAAITGSVMAAETSDAAADSAPIAPPRKAPSRVKPPKPVDVAPARLDAAPGNVEVSVTDLGGYPLEGTEGEESIAPENIYSPADDGVHAPVLLRPVIPEPAGPDAPPDTIAVFELVVGRTGAVEQVHVISFPRHFHDRMIVSHVKAWTFQPATRDGQPVRYRLVVRLSV
jgi:hypothetical protein